MEDLPLGRIAALVPEFAVKDLPLGRTLMMMMMMIHLYLCLFTLHGELHCSLLLLQYSTGDVTSELWLWLKINLIIYLPLQKFSPHRDSNNLVWINAKARQPPQLVSDTRMVEGWDCDEAINLMSVFLHGCRPTTPEAPPQDLIKCNETKWTGWRLEKLWNKISGRGKREKPRENLTRLRFVAWLIDI